METSSGWAILELFGHRILAGRVREVERFGAKFCQIEIPLGEPPPAGQEEKFFVQRYGGGAVYCETPVDQAVARERAARVRPMLTPLLPAGTTAPEIPEAEVEELEAPEDEPQGPMEDLGEPPPVPLPTSEPLIEVVVDPELVRKVTRRTAAQGPEVVTPSPMPPETPDIPF